MRLSYPENGEFEIAPTVDISGHGARVVSRTLWQPDIRLSVQSISGDLYSRARVVHCKALANASYMIAQEKVCRHARPTKWNIALVHLVNFLMKSPAFISSTEKRNREALIAKRNQLFWRRFLNNPKETALAFEIKLLYDRISEITQRMVEQERDEGHSEKKSA